MRRRLGQSISGDGDNHVRRAVIGEIASRHNGVDIIAAQFLLTLFPALMHRSISSSPAHKRLTSRRQQRKRRHYLFITLAHLHVTASI